MPPEPVLVLTMPQEERWRRVLYGASVDGDIEHLLAALETRHGYTRKKANAELVRRLSQAVS